MKHGLCSSVARILVVDDHSLSRRFIASALRQNGADVKQVGTAAAAEALAREWRPQVILMDFRLGDADGFAVARRIRADWPRALALPRIVMLTAEALDGDQMTTFRGDVDDVLLKPIEPGFLLRAVWGVPQAPPHAVSEQGLSQLRSLFRSELSTCLNRLDAFMASHDLTAARGVLHQLLASSGMCGERQLNRDLRALHESCGTAPEARELSRSYFAVLVSARAFLRPETAKKPV